MTANEASIMGMKDKSAVQIETTLIGALAKALPELESAKKNKENPAFKNGGKVMKYEDLAAVIEALEPIRAHGLWFRQVSRENENGVMLETFYIHESGQELSAGLTFMPASKRDAQGFGSALTYCRRYALKTAFGLASEDDDGNAAVKTIEQREPEAPEPLISDAQHGELMLLFTHLSVPVGDFLAKAKVDKLNNLQARRFEKSKQWINDTAKKVRQEMGSV